MMGAPGAAGATPSDRLPAPSDSGVDACCCWDAPAVQLVGRRGGPQGWAALLGPSSPLTLSSRLLAHETGTWLLAPRPGGAASWGCQRRAIVNMVGLQTAQFKLSTSLDMYNTLYMKNTR